VPLPPKHTVTFDPNGGTVRTPTREYYEGSNLGSLPKPSRPGFKFLGWRIGRGGEFATPYTKVANGMTLVAEIRKNPKLSNLLVYAVTADIEMLNTYQKDGFTGLLLKPYNIAKLTEFFNQIS
jgi:hypothetical protein